MKRKATAFVLVLAMAMVLIGSAFAAESSTDTWQVSVGKETDAASLDSMFPKVVYIHEGDKVVFTNAAKFTPHTVTFLAGKAPLSPEDPASVAPSAASSVSWDGKTLLNSGILEPTKTYEITFTASGAYPYYCILHPLMSGTVVVVPKGQPIPSKVEQAAATKAQENELILQAEALKGNHEIQYTDNGNGSLTYKVALGSAHTTLSHNRMTPDLVTISEGDSVEWSNLSPYEPHWVTFNKPADLDFFTDQGLNPKFLAPAGGSEFNGKGFINSGVVMNGQSYKLKFTKAGTYTYECYLHSGSLMKGTVVVFPKNAVKFVVNGKAVADSAKAQWKNGSLYVSIPSFAQAMGGKAVYDSKLKAIVVTVGQGSQAKKVQTASIKLNGTNYASAEQIVRALGGTYTWNEKTKTFTVTVGAAATADHTGHQ
ncbi:hypothetical protein SD71_18950 [Cohnella kolymensis]|uniref:Blue (type 1) copper domain-containing protein n=1 Tax=Cohnella kolymensis TaxID=1590652 RepID=A0ABR5A0U0_9BACL|nr:plastocyanin/azurin family copper-binding protein [Cohnella kolymensis]KIL34552.1 hypothetical protein SD71_18950 [Cohnella kolymensis]